MQLKQLFQLIKLLGVRGGLKLKKRHAEALPLIRGYAATTCIWTLLNVGFWDELLAAGSGGIDLAAYCNRNKFDPHVLESICSYLDGIGLLAMDHARNIVQPTARTADLLAEPRGLFELLYAYEPVFVELEPMLRGHKQYGRDVQRRTRWVGLGSGRLCRQLPYPVMTDMVARHGRRSVLDLGCGDGAFLMELAARAPSIHAQGIDIDESVVRLAGEQIASAGLSDRVNVAVADMFDLKGSATSDQQSALSDRHLLNADRFLADSFPIDCLTACDTFHEYLWTGDDRVIELLKGLKRAFPGALMVVGEFCKQSHESLRKRPTAFLEHHLFHQLTNQRIESAEAWRAIFARAGLTIREERVFDLVGHGYFVLE